MDLQLKDKVALVTAASKGLGKASAHALSREGAKVAISARSDLLDAAAGEIRQDTGGEVLAVRGDVTIQEDIDKMVGSTLDKFGKIDILVLNAGGAKPGGFLDVDSQDWMDGVNLTLMSAVRLCYAVIPHMLDQGSGSIVAIESYSVKQPIDNLILSNSLRLAVIGFLKSLANEFGPKGIRVNSVNPAWTWTERIQEIMKSRSVKSGLSIEEETANVINPLPLKRLGTVEEFGNTVAWIASPAAGFVHGHALMIDGGGVKTPL